MYKHGRAADIERLLTICRNGGGVAICKLNKMPDGKLIREKDFEICDIDAIPSSICARYCKHAYAHKDNLVIEIEEVLDERELLD